MEAESRLNAKQGIKRKETRLMDICVNMIQAQAHLAAIHSSTSADGVRLKHLRIIQHFAQYIGNIVVVVSNSTQIAIAKFTCNFTDVLRFPGILPLYYIAFRNP